MNKLMKYVENNNKTIDIKTFDINIDILIFFRI